MTGWIALALIVAVVIATAAVRVCEAKLIEVILLEPLIDLAVLFGAKTLHRFKDSALLHRRLHYAAS